MTKQPEKQPAQVTAERGEVMMDGPDGIAISLTPEAAHRTAQALHTAAGEAKQQRSPTIPPSSPGDREGGGPDAA